MHKPILALLLVLSACTAVEPDPELQRWQEQARRISIIRDNWGVAHVYGATDADAVFGMIYAQAEDDFNRIEINYLNAMGRLAEAEGEAAVFRDLRMKLFIDPDELRSLYDESPAWLRDLMDAWAAGLNYYLRTHPETRPRVIRRFEPWMALSFTEGSIGGDIERVSTSELERFYGAAVEREQLVATAATLPPEPTGSNGFAIAPSNSASGNALLLINPHTSFYFRSELQMTSDEGLNAYGAVTWGQFFVYQGFNETAGWMHTSTGADNIDEFYYDVSVRDDGVYYPYDGEERRLREKIITVPYRSGDGLEEQRFRVFYSHHGPIVRSEDGRWISTALMNEPIGALTQSYTRTKAANYDEYREIMELHTNSSNNTVFADAEGNIAYFHSNFVPVRSVDYDWSAPVSGMESATEWQGLHAVDDSPNSLNPPGGWIQNTNNWPYSVSGPSSPQQQDYPPYFDRFGENFRGLNAVRVLDGVTDFTLETLRDAAYDSYLTGFEALLPPLIAAYDSAPSGGDAGAAIELLRQWDYRFGLDSVATSVAVFWGRDVLPRLQNDANAAGVSTFDYLRTAAPPSALVDSLQRALERLAGDFGDWRTPWGEINRFQRISSSVEPVHDDSRESIPVAFTSARWGSLASFGANRFDTKRLYGSYGNSFVAVVEFGERLRALAVTAGGLSSDPASPHFNDQAARYASGDLRPVHFYREDVEANAERTYQPGEPN
jgi:acyl-homoserine-lactone acylase